MVRACDAGTCAVESLGEKCVKGSFYTKTVPCYFEYLLHFSSISYLPKHNLSMINKRKYAVY
jgi:hypothetical protein